MIFVRCSRCGDVHPPRLPEVPRCPLCHNQALAVVLAPDEVAEYLSQRGRPQGPAPLGPFAA